MSPSSLAEAALHEFVLQRFGGPFPTLEEHAEHGLPELDETVALLGTGGWSTATLPSGYLPRWLAGMLLHHEFLAMGMPELPSLHAFYNATVSPSDCRAPSYRHVVVAARELSPERLVAAVDSLRTDVDRDRAKPRSVGSRAPCCRIASEGACGRVSRRRSAPRSPGSSSRLPIATARSPD